MPVPARRRPIATPSAPLPALTLESLYREHLDFVLRAARHIGGRRISAEDVAQEVFLIVHRRLGSFVPRANVTSWLYGITFNVVRTKCRRLHLEALHRAEEAEGRHVALEARDPIEVSEAWGVVDEILDSMSSRKRQVFLLGELDELPCAEIARIVGSKEATVWSRLYYARRHFAQRLERHRRDQR
jgi:RNA polymerase sigma-70 factor (ECF subfamily)